MPKIVNFINAEYMCHESWDKLFDSNMLNSLLSISNALEGKSYTPNEELVLRFLSINLSKVSVVILGQDPYPQEGVATGRAFEVNNIKCWNKIKEISLQNILKLLYKNQSMTDDILSIKDIRKEIKKNNFQIAAPNDLFNEWEEKGVLLLNTVLTCPVGNTSGSNKHRKIWTDFTQNIICYIYENYPNIKWFLWGNNAKKSGISIPEESKFESFHPRSYCKKPGYFFYENHFTKVKDIKWSHN